MFETTRMPIQRDVFTAVAIVDAKAHYCHHHHRRHHHNHHHYHHVKPIAGGLLVATCTFAVYMYILLSKNTSTAVIKSTQAQPCASRLK